MFFYTNVCKKCFNLGLFSGKSCNGKQKLFGHAPRDIFSYPGDQEARSALRCKPGLQAQDRSKARGALQVRLPSRHPGGGVSSAASRVALGVLTFSVSAVPLFDDNVTLFQRRSRRSNLLSNVNLKLTDITVSQTILASAERVFDVWIDPKSPGGPWFGAERVILNPVVDGLFYFAVKHEGKMWPITGGSFKSIAPVASNTPGCRRGPRALSP